MPDDFPEWFRRLTPEQRRQFAEAFNNPLGNLGRMQPQISPMQATALGFPSRDQMTGLLKADFNLFRFESDGTL